ncbi:6-phosphofructokinase [Lactovum miscens]|uniref:6-phosphofructokinase 1 n=1 Tax=Lactovum miscens TaxID=190387 RepID=A0A841C7A9_9LACT|nr:6-phosphofructokinase [Lactovum miscens]MBB5887279.1 6-phosphofructokinase 1 [Lactovum miscens]
MRKIGILTSGGDCAGLNPAIYALARSLYTRLDEVELIGIYDGYTGLIDLNFKKLELRDFDDLLDKGGTFLRSIRQSFKTIDVKNDKGYSKADRMVENYKALKLDALVTLGGNGTHKVANLLSQRGLNIVALPKTIDNDIFGTEETFGYQTAIQRGVEYIEVLKTTAASHSRIFLVEIMGNKVGWLPLETGVASGSDVILLPEIPYDIKKVAGAIKKTLKIRNYAIVTVAEGAFSKGESRKFKERVLERKAAGYNFVSDKLAAELAKIIPEEMRTAVPGHFLRGGAPNAYDINYTMQLGDYAAKLIENEVYGVTVAKIEGDIHHNLLSEVAGVAKPVTEENRLMKAARNVGISFGD